MKPFMKIEISLASAGEKNILRNLMQYYLYEFSTIDGMDVEDDTGLFSYPYLDRYWTEAERYPFITRINGNLAGFALLRRGSYFPHPSGQNREGMIIAEFFVMKKFRREGIGTRVATHLFYRFPGRWEIAQVANNLNSQSPVSPFPGQAFWRTMIREYCRGNYEEIELDNEIWIGPVQVFENTHLLPE